MGRFRRAASAIASTTLVGAGVAGVLIPPAAATPPTPKVALSSSSVMLDEGQSTTLTVTLAEPIVVPEGAPETLTIDFTSSDPSRVSLSPNPVAYTPDEWHQHKSFVVTAVQNGVHDAPGPIQVHALVHTASEYYKNFALEFVVNVNDDDPVVPPPSDIGYWMVDDAGTVTGFGAATARASVGVGTAAAIAAVPGVDAYWVMATDGRSTANGDGATTWAPAPVRDGERVVAVTPTSGGMGALAFTDTGRVTALGTTQTHGDLSGVALNRPVVDAAATATGSGYFMVAADGGVFAFGDAVFAGSMAGTPLNAPIVSIAVDPDGSGYWLVAADG